MEWAVPAWPLRADPFGQGRSRLLAAAHGEATSVFPDSSPAVGREVMPGLGLGQALGREPMVAAGPLETSEPNRCSQLEHPWASTGALVARPVVEQAMLESWLAAVSASALVLNGHLEPVVLWSPLLLW